MTGVVIPRRTYDRTDTVDSAVMPWYTFSVWADSVRADSGRADIPDGRPTNLTEG
jgi:hypothetical protein